MNLNMFDTDGMTASDRDINSRMNQPTTNKSYNGELSAFPSATPLAMAYVPFQQWGETKSAEEALDCGTLFNDLVFPFMEVGK